MSKIDIVNRIAAQTGEKKATVSRVLESLHTVVTTDLATTGKAQIPGVAHLTKVTRAGRIRRNPKTGEILGMTEPKTGAKFKALKALTGAL